MTRTNKEDRILILENAKWIWSKEEIERAASLFSEGYMPSQVAIKMNMRFIDIGLLYLHLIDKRKVTFKNK
ncbi:hypothetical protein [Enterococcus sp. AZ103]|uniref:hypothetical protein n=1 Tax=Enterococcus sp. AZ103 TaxID=2774628 RepID=UPI003F68673C